MSKKRAIAILATLTLFAASLAFFACRKPVEVIQTCSFEAAMVIPAPLNAPTFEPDGPFPGSRAATSKLLTVMLDETGVPESVLATAIEDSSWARYLENWLLAHRFGAPPAAPFKLVLRANYVRRDFNLQFPVDSVCRATDQDLIDLTLRSNDYQPARIAFFPSYYCDLGPQNPDPSRHYLLFQLDLDSAGLCREARLVSGNYPAFVGQLTSALLYAQFEPARFRGQAVESSPFLRVVFYPFNRYPTQPVDDSTRAGLTFHERQALRILNDTSGVICKPIPTMVPYDSVSVVGRSGVRTQRLTLSIRIDTAGNVAVSDWRGLSEINREGVRRITRSLKFFPAFDVRGRPVTFEDIITLDFAGTRRVKIIYHWLELGR